MGETYIKMKGEWTYHYRAVDKIGKTLDFMLPKRRNKADATNFFARSIEVNDLPENRDRKKRGQHGRHHRDQPHAEVLRLLDRDRDGADQIPRQHHRCRTIAPSRSESGQCSGSSLSSQPRQRSKSSKFLHDPQGPVAARTLPVSPFRGTGRLIE